MICFYGNNENITVINTEYIDIMFLGWIYENENNENENHIAG